MGSSHQNKYAARHHTKTAPIHRYPNGDAYSQAKGRASERKAVTDTRDWSRSLAVIDLHNSQPSAAEFVKKIVREFKIRCYARNSISNYRSGLESFLRWSGRKPHELNSEHVREYLEYLVDSNGGASQVSLHLSAIRTAFDKLCFQDITLGLATPRKPKRLPVVLSEKEVVRLLGAADRLRDKLLLGLMYATGMRVGEVVKVRWSDIELERNSIRIRQGKGSADRYVMLPVSYRNLFESILKRQKADGFVFPSECQTKARANQSRFISPRTVQRVMARAVEIAGIKKAATPHSLRHSFATHSFENGCDIRRIQKILGHVHLETTTIYVKVANPEANPLMPSPLDQLNETNALKDSFTIGSGRSRRQESREPSGCQARPPVGSIRVHHRQFPHEEATRVTLEVLAPSDTQKANDVKSVYLTGVRALESRPCFWTLSFPTLEVWEKQMQRLSSAQRRRWEEPGFYQNLSDAIIRSLKKHSGDQDPEPLPRQR